MAPSQRKVILRRFFGGVLHGYLPSAGFVHDGRVSLLDLDGRLSSVPLEETKAIFYVRDFNRGDAVNPERMTRKTFLSRPRGEGIWVRLTFRDDGEQLEGLAPADLGLLDDLLGDSGLQLAPPDIRSNTQRIFVPRSSIAELQLLAVLTSPTRRLRRESQVRSIEPDSAQESLFESSEPKRSESESAAYPRPRKLDASA